ncbi:MAG: TauD/TfdA family dioxygenase [Gemmatimonadetes bacterium]|nr:TauD/TfdA family dioxygenase [Gemmatimonadota bacterium]
MIPLTRGARHLLDWIARAIAASQAVTVEWRPGRSLLFDNWRVLHGRGLAQRIGERTLIRTTYDVL